MNVDTEGIAMFLHVGLVVKSQREIRFAESVVKSGLKQRARTTSHFLGRLPNEHDRAVPLIF